MNFNKICRLCAEIYGDDDLLNMFSNDLDVNVIAKIESFAPIQISIDDGLPATICSICYYKSIDAYDFRLQIIKSIEKLKTKLNEENTTEWENNLLIPLDDIGTDVSSDNESKKFETILDYQISDNTISNTSEQNTNTKEKEHRKVKKQSDSTSKTTVCPVCGKILKRNSFSDHLSNVHQDEANIECNVCRKMFKNKRQLWHHKRKHQDTTVSCDQCGKTFKTKEGFRSHFRTIHLGIRNHSCKICNRKFARIMALKRHMRSHTGERPYVCSYCSRSFAGSWNLKQHIRLHTKEKPYQCQICGEAFTQNVMLKLHAKNKHS